MLIPKSLRSWLVGTACLSLTFAGCAAPSGGGPTAALSQNKAPSTTKQLKNPKRLHLAHAKWQEQIGNAKAARESYEFVLDKDKKSVDAIVGLARLDQLAGRTDEAERGFLKALEIQPDSPTALSSAGQFYATHEQWEPAIKMLQAAVAAAPQDSAYEHQLAIVLARSGDIPGAREHFVRSVGDAESHYNIGYILKESGKLAAAEQEFMQALVKKPDLEEAQLLLEEIRQERQQGIALAANASTPGLSQAAVQTAYNPAGGTLPPQAPPFAGHRQPQSAQNGVAAHQQPHAPQSGAGGSWNQPAASAAVPAPNANLTPRQREQLMNQLGR